MGDPISLIMAALVAGAAKTAGEAVSDGYKGLKDLIKRKLEEKKQPPFVQGMLDANKDQLEDQGNQDFLKEKLVAVKVHEDVEILNAAKALIESMQSNQEKSSSQQNFNNQIQAKNVALQQGYNTTANNTFN
jgi:hypothetical protein